MTPARLRLLLLASALLIVLQGCGKRWGEVERLDLGEPSPHLERLVMARVVSANEGLLNTYQVFEGERLEGTISHTIIPWDMAVGATEGLTWRAYENEGSYVQFHFIPGTGYAATVVHNPRNEGTILFDTPLVFVPPVIALGEPHTHHVTFEAWAKGWRRRRGTMTVTTEFLGLQDVEVPIGRVTQCARVDALIRIRLPMGLSLTINHRQWLHPAYGDVIRDIDGRLSWVGMGVRTFRRRLELATSVPLDPLKRQEMIARGAGEE